MRHVLVGLLVAAIAFAGCADAGPQASPSMSPVAPSASPGDALGSIQGLVTDQESVPIQGADVVLVETQQSAKTDASGAFTFNGLEPGEHTLLAQRLGYAQGGRKVSVAAGEVAEATIQLEEFVLAPEPYVDLHVRKALIQLGQVFLDNRYPAGYRQCSACDSYLKITLAPAQVRLEPTFTNGVSLPNDDIWIDFRINFQNATGSNSLNDGTSLGSDYLSDREAWTMPEDSAKHLAKTDMVWYHVASGVTPSVNKRIDSYVSFAYHGPLAESYTALPPA